LSQSSSFNPIRLVNIPVAILLGQIFSHVLGRNHDLIPRTPFGLFWREPLGAWIYAYMGEDPLYHPPFHWQSGKNSFPSAHLLWLRGTLSQRLKGIGSGWWNYSGCLGTIGKQVQFATGARQPGFPSPLRKILYHHCYYRLFL
jgi:hypothetical protein